MGKMRTLTFDKCQCLPCIMFGVNDGDNENVDFVSNFSSRNTQTLKWMEFWGLKNVTKFQR